MQLLKMSALSVRVGEPKATLYWRISRGERPPSIKQGPRAAAFSVEEYDTVTRALAAGASRDEIRALVRKLVAARGVSQ